MGSTLSPPEICSHRYRLTARTIIVPSNKIVSLMKEFSDLPGSTIYIRKSGGSALGCMLGGVGGTKGRSLHHNPGLTSFPHQEGDITGVKWCLRRGVRVFMTSLLPQST